MKRKHSLLVIIHSSCGNPTRKELIPVSRKLFCGDFFPVDYCQKCKLYIFNHDNNKGIEDSNPEKVSKYLNKIKREMLNGK